MIPEWDLHFENAQSRQYDTISWTAFPNSHDGNGFGRIAAQGDPDAARILAAFVLIVQVASKCPIRGILWDKGSPLDTEDLAVKTRFPKAMFDDAIPVLMKKKIGWLSWGRIDSNGKPCQSTASALLAATSTASPKGKKGKKGREGKRTEGTGSDDVSIEDYSDIQDQGNDPIAVAYAVTGEAREDRITGFLKKALNAIGDESFRDQVATVFGEKKAGECQNAGACLTMKLKKAMKGKV